MKVFDDELEEALPLLERAAVERGSPALAELVARMRETRARREVRYAHEREMVIGNLAAALPANVNGTLAGPVVPTADAPGG